MQGKDISKKKISNFIFGVLFLKKMYLINFDQHKVKGMIVDFNRIKVNLHGRKEEK